MASEVWNSGGFDRNEEMPNMPVQQYCLRWNNHRSNLLLVFEHLFQTESFTDVTLACEGTSIKCHKMVLAACSSFFQSLFIENECPHPIVIMKDIKFLEIRAILEYMYRGEVNVAQDQLAGLLKAAETLRVKGLVEDNNQLPQSSPRSPRRSPVPSSSNPSTHSDYQSPSTSTATFQKTTAFPSSMNKYSNPEPIFDNTNSASYNATVERTPSTSGMQLPIWPQQKLPSSPSPKHTNIYDNSQNEPVLLKKKKFMGTNKDTPILRTVLGHTSIQQNMIEPSPSTSMQSTPVQQKSLNYSHTSNGPINHNDKMHVESPEYMDDSIRSVESDRGQDDNPPLYSTETEDKNAPGPAIANYVPSQKPEWKRYKQYTRHDILNAIEAVRSGMSALQAARKFCVPSRTLYDKVKKLGITTNRPYRKGNFPASPYQGINLKTEEGAGFSPEEQSSDPTPNGIGTESISGNGSETDGERMDSESGVDRMNHQMTSPSIHDDNEREDSNHVQDDQPSNLHNNTNHHNSE